MLAAEFTGLLQLVRLVCGAKGTFPQRACVTACDVHSVAFCGCLENGAGAVFAAGLGRGRPVGTPRTTAILIAVRCICG